MVLCGPRTAYKIKGIDIVLEVGQVAASDVELAEFLDCNRKTVGKLIARFNRLGMLTTRTNNRTSVHSLHFLTGWYVGGVLITNPHYVRPSATAKGQTGDVRTPVSDSLPSGDELEAAAVDCHTRGKETDSQATGAASLYSSYSSLLLSDSSNPSADVHDGDCHNPPSRYVHGGHSRKSAYHRQWRHGIRRKRRQGATARRRTARMAARLLRHRLGRSGSIGSVFERYSVVVG